MSKISLLFVLALLILSCKKTETPLAVVPVEKPKISVDTSHPFEGLIFSDYKESANAKMNGQSDITFLGFLTDTKSVNNQTFNPLMGAGLINTEYSLTDADSLALEQYKLSESVLSTFRISYNEMLKNNNHVFLPKISYQIYASKDMPNANKTELTLVVKAVYYYLELSEPKDENLKIYPNVEIDKIKKSGAYLSRIGYGMESVFEISTDRDPKKCVAYLKAYLNDILNNNGANAAELRKEFDIPTVGFTYLGGELSEWFKYQHLSNTEKIERYVKELFVLKPINSAFKSIEFDYRPLSKS